VLLDARYERVHEGRQLIDCAVLVAVGIDASGRRRVLGISVMLSEAEVRWRAFLDSLIQRGLRGTSMWVSSILLLNPGVNPGGGSPHRLRLVGRFCEQHP
jgi:transposase-like protein